MTVLLNESGKAGPHLIVGAVWFADPEEFFKLTRQLGEWRERSGFSAEVHFRDLDDRPEPYFREAVELVLTECASVSFKAASVPKEGVKRIDKALEELMYQLLRRGAQHEPGSCRYTCESGRTGEAPWRVCHPWPRTCGLPGG